MIDVTCCCCFWRTPIYPRARAPTVLQRHVLSMREETSVPPPPFFFVATVLCDETSKPVASHPSCGSIMIRTGQGWRTSGSPLPALPALPAPPPHPAPIASSSFPMGTDDDGGDAKNASETTQPPQRKVPPCLVV